uniref:Uncharacterized protein n=1 Tax=Human herpesvirus 2 TaxID=10310 RepID=A0A481TD44_HHV2|nr:hypothetical protein [Human alphaherpesvirus 2]
MRRARAPGGGEGGRDPGPATEKGRGPREGNRRGCRASPRTDISRPPPRI